MKDFRIIETTLGDVLVRRDRDEESDPVMVISWIDAVDTHHSMSLGFLSAALARAAVASMTPEFAEKWVQQQSKLFQ